MPPRFSPHQEDEEPPLRIRVHDDPDLKPEDVTTVEAILNLSANPANDLWPSWR